MARPVVLLTGASGFIGRAVLKPLQQAGFDVHAVGRRGAEPSTAFHLLDLLRDDPRPLLAQLRPSHLLHLAWVSDRSRLWHSTDNLDWVAATLRLVRAFGEAGGERAVLAGSAAEYDWNCHTLDEAETPLLPHSLYGRAKQVLFDLLGAAPAAELPSWAWGRIFFPFGSDDKPDRLLSQVIDGVARGEAVSCSSGRQVRPFLHVDDAAGALVALLQSDVTGPVNIAIDEQCSVRELVLHAARLAGNAELVRFGSRPLQPGEPPFMRAVVRRLTEEVGFKPRFTIADGVAHTVRGRLASNEPAAAVRPPRA